MSLRAGNEQELYEVLQGSKAVWGVGISLEDYLAYHSLIRNHPWSRENYQHLILTDEQGKILSSCKIYQHQVRIDSELFQLCALGAIFTPPHYRRLGYASQMLECLIDQLSEQGFDLVMLFSDIGTEFYQRLGFRLFAKEDPVFIFSEKSIVPAEIQLLNHLPQELREWDECFDQSQRFALLKSPGYFQLLSDRILWHQKYLGFKEQKVIVSFPEQSYLWVDLNRSRILIRRFGTRAPEPEQALARLLSSLKAQLNFSELSGWLPREFEQYPSLRLRKKEPRTRTLMMILALNPRAEKVYELSPEEIQFWLADYF